MLAAAGCSRGPTGAEPALLQGVVMTDSGERVAGAEVQLAFSLALASEPALLVVGTPGLDDVPEDPGGGPFRRFFSVRNNPCTSGRFTFEFGLPKNGHATIRVRGGRGAIRRRVSDQTFAAGRHSMTWDGRDDDGRPLPSGVYAVEWSDDEGDSAFTAVRYVLWQVPLPDAAPNAVTDAEGRFELPLETIPVGVPIETRDASGRYWGRFLVANYLQVCARAEIAGDTRFGCAATVDVGDRQRDVKARVRVR